MTNIVGSARSLTTTVSFIDDGLNAPKITADPQSHTNAVEGSSLSLNVSAAGSDPLSYQWYRKPFYSSNGQNNEPFEPISGGTAASLVIPNTVSYIDSGYYQAVVRNSHGSVTSAVATVFVRPKMVGFAFIHTGSVLGQWTFPEGDAFSLNV